MMENLFSPPQNRVCLAQRVLETEGCVIGAGNLCIPDQTAARLEYQEAQPAVLLDMGPLSPGGYPVFRVKKASAGAKLRICYYDWLETAKGKTARQYGDFIRGSCKYLGVELPVLPANPNRYECYTLHRTGEYLYPLIQGQQRFVRIMLEEPGTFVELESFYIHYTSDISIYEGSFACHDSRLTKLWYSSAYTAKLATIRSSQWETLNGKLLLRSLTQSKDLGYLKEVEWHDATISFSCQLSFSPDFVSGISWAIGIHGEHAFVLSLTLDSMLHVLEYHAGGYREITPAIRLNQEIRDNWSYQLKTVCKGNCITVFLDETEIFHGELPGETDGKIGFCQQAEQVAVLESLEITDSEKNSRSWDVFEGELPEWKFAQSPWFMADGAKRDRIPWSGDLAWAGPNTYYASRSSRGIRGALELLAFHQNPQGYVYGTCYPESNKKPGNKEWGHYESDLFSMWHAVSLAQYVLFTGDLDFLHTHYGCLQKNLEYLWHFVDERGLFYQRYETSKGLWDHELGDKGTHAYHNLLFIWALYSGANMAEEMNDLESSVRYHKRAEKVRAAINKYLWNEETGCYQKGLGHEDFCFLANALAMAIGFPSRKQASKIAPQLLNIQSHGKIVALAIAGLYRYGYPEFANRLMMGINPLPEEIWGKGCCISWLGILEDETAPHTTTECMIYPLLSKGDGLNWGDMSHPDTGLAGILSGYLLGILPQKPGFREYVIAPADWSLGKASGTVPVGEQDNIRLEWTMTAGSLQMELEHPTGCAAIVVLPKCGQVHINGQQTDNPLIIDRPGRYLIQAEECIYSSSSATAGKNSLTGGGNHE